MTLCTGLLVTANFLALAAADTDSEAATPQKGGAREVTRVFLLDRIHGGWAGMLIGGLEGLPHEFRYNEQPRATLPEFTFLEQGAHSDDDNDFEWPHLWHMDREDMLKLPYPRLVEIWKANMNQGIWVANKRARDLMDQGLVPPATGSPLANPHAGYNLSGQFCVEAYGMIAPGMPQTAAELGLHYARIAVSEEPLQATQFWTSLISLMAFHEGPLETALDTALAAVDPASAMAEVVTDARRLHREHPGDWKTARQAIHEKWVKQKKWNMNSTPSNGALVLLALLYGEGDFYKTLQYAMALGYDADCNAATAGAVLGTRLGFRHLAALPQFRMPDRYLNKTRPSLPAECKVTEQAETLMRVCERVILAEGGERIEVKGQPGYRVRLQPPRPISRLESANLPVVFELDLGQTQQIQVRGPAGPVERRIRLLDVRAFYWPNYHIPDLPQRRVFRSAEVDVEVSGTRATLHARPFEMPQMVNGLRLYIETTRGWATEPQLDPMPEVRRAVRFSCVAAGTSWGPSELRFPIGQYRWRANTYGNTWLALVPYNKHYYHRGEDFGAIPDQLEVLASLGGVITRSPLPTGDQESNGLQIRCPFGLELGYFHMNLETVLPYHTNGAAVRTGDLLGRTGMTWAGRKSQHNDPHLHWGVSVRGAPVASYPFVAEAYLRDYADPLLAVAGGYHYAIPGETVELDASRSLARPGRRIVRYQWRLHDGRDVEGPRASVKADHPGLFSEELRLLADDGSEDRDYAQLRVWNTNPGAAFAAGWFYHWPVRGARPGTPVLFWNRLFGTTGPVEIDFGDDSNSVRIGQEITHAYAKAGIYTAALRSRGPADEPVEVRMRVVIDP
ncbi:MAG: ADP-ribosylglycohydrolase family protein [Verrucomicrobiia bacterium]